MQALTHHCLPMCGVCAVCMHDYLFIYLFIYLFKLMMQEIKGVYMH